MIFLYIFCILFPLLLISSIFFFNISEKIREKQNIEYTHKVERISQNVFKTLNDCKYLIEQYNMDPGIYDFINTTYDNPGAFVEEYNNFFSKPLDSYNPFYKNIFSLKILTSNPTVLDSELITHVGSELMSQSFFENLQLTDTNRFFYLLANGQKAEEKPDTIALYKELDYWWHLGNYRNILVMEIKTSFFKSILESDGNKDIYFLLDNNKHIASANLPLIKNKFIDFDTTEYTDFIRYERSIKIAKSNINWTLYGFYKKNNTLISSKGILYLFLAVSIVILITSGLILWISQSIYFRLHLLSEHMDNSEDDNIYPIEIKNIGEDEISTVITSYNALANRVKYLIEDIYKAEQREKNLELAQKQAQLNELKSKVNPHYLFNILETIRMKCLGKKEFETADILLYMSKSYRRILKWEDDFICLDDEIQFIKEFLEIQKFRFDERLNYSINVTGDLNDVLLPKMIIQAFIENTCIHGFQNSNKNCLVELDLCSDAGTLYIEISDNGIGIDEVKLKNINKSLNDNTTYEDHFGIILVFQRLKHFFSDFDLIVKSQIDRGTCIYIKIPIIRK